MRELEAAIEKSDLVLQEERELLDVRGRKVACGQREKLENRRARRVEAAAVAQVFVLRQVVFRSVGEQVL
jgi:hypothetical protein